MDLIGHFERDCNSPIIKCHAYLLGNISFAVGYGKSKGEAVHDVLNIIGRSYVGCYSLTIDGIHACNHPSYKSYKIYHMTRKKSGKSLAIIELLLSIAPAIINIFKKKK